MPVTSNTADDSTFTAASARGSKTAAMLIKFFLKIYAFQGTILVGKVVNLISAAQIVNRVVAGIATYYDFPDSSYYAHIEHPF